MGVRVRVRTPIRAEEHGVLIWLAGGQIWWGLEVGLKERRRLLRKELVHAGVARMIALHLVGNDIRHVVQIGKWMVVIGRCGVEVLL